MYCPNIISSYFEACTPDKEKVVAIPPYNMLHFVISGSGYFNGEKISAGQGFIALSGKHVQYYQDKNDPWTYAWINFSDAEVLSELVNTVKFDKNMVFSFNIQFPYLDIIKDYAVTKNFDNNKSASHYNASMFYHIMSYLKNDPFCSRNSETVSLRTKHIKDCETFIEYNYYRPYLSIQYISDQLHISRAYLRNLFVKYKNTTPQQYLIDFRMKKAADFLVSTESSVSVISSSVGYHDQFQFSKMFKKTYGISPNEYRKKHKK